MRKEWRILQEELRVSQLSNKVFVDQTIQALDNQEIDSQTLLRQYGTSSLGIIRAFLQYTLDFFNTLHTCFDPSIADAEQEKLLRDILIMHGNVVSRSSMDYFLNPSLAIHAACLLVAKFIVGSNESLINILLPSVKRIVGIVPTDETGSFLSFISNELFCFEDFLLSSNGEDLIDLQGIYHYARENPDRLFDVKSNKGDERYFFVDPIERYQFRIIGGQASIDYVGMLEKIYRINHDERPSIGYELRKLKEALLLSSKANGGSETIANDAACQGPIKVFHQHWNALHGVHKNKIKNYKALGATNTLESLLLVLFAYTVGVSNEEFERVTHEKIFVCTHQIGQQLDALIKYHPDLNEIPLRACSKNFSSQALPTSEKVDALLNGVISALKKRAISGLDTQLLVRFSFFTKITQYFYQPLCQEFVDDRLKKLVPTVNNLNQLAAVLLLLPKEHFNAFFVVAYDDICKLVQSVDAIQTQRMRMATANPGEMNDLMRNGFLDADALVYLLKLLPVFRWSSLFAAISHSKLTIYFFSNGLGHVIRQLPKHEWRILRNAMDTTLIGTVLRTGIDLSSLLASVSDDAREYIINLFYTEIKNILKNTRYLANFFVQSIAVAWDDLFRFFVPMIKDYVQEPNWVESFFSALVRDLEINVRNRVSVESMIMSFLEKFVVSFPEWSLKNSKSFLNFMECFPRECCSRVCDLIGKSFCNNYLTNERNLQDFLAESASVGMRKLLLHFLSPFIQLNRGISAKNLEALLRNYPECESSLLQIARSSLKEMMLRFLITFESCNEVGDKYPVKVLNQFYFLLDKALPVLMSLDYLQLNVRSEEWVALPECAQQFINNMESVDRIVKENNCEILDASYRKLRLLDKFFSEMKTLSKKSAVEPTYCVFFEALVERLPPVNVLISMLDERQKNCLTFCDTLKARVISIGVSPEELDRELQDAKTVTEVKALLNLQGHPTIRVERVLYSPAFQFRGRRHEMVDDYIDVTEMHEITPASEMTPPSTPTPAPEDSFDTEESLREDAEIIVGFIPSDDEQSLRQ